MGLVGVSGFGGGADEVKAFEGAESLEAEYPLEGLRAVADGAVEAAPQLPVAEAEIVGEPVDPLPGVAQPERGCLHGDIGRSEEGQARRQCAQSRQRRFGVEAPVEVVGRVQSEIGQRHAQIADLRQRQAIGSAAGTGPQADADYDLLVDGRRKHRAGIWAGDERPGASPPDDVGAAIRQHAHRRTIPAPHPKTRDRMTEGNRCWVLAVGVRFVQDRRLVHRLNAPMDIVFVATIAVIAPDPAESRKLYVDALGLPLAAAAGSDYWHSESVAGTKHFGVWPLTEAAQACLGQSEWPADRPRPQASIEFEVADAAAVQAAAEELEDRGFELLHAARQEPWGQTVARLLSAEGLIVGISFAPSLHNDGEHEGPGPVV